VAVAKAPPAKPTIRAASAQVLRVKASAAPAVAVTPARPVPAAVVKVKASTSPAVAAARPQPAKPATKLAGAPIQLVDASGSPDAARRIRLRLTRLGWSVQAAPASRPGAVEATRIDYPGRATQIAQALARTLSGPVRVRACAGVCPAIRLVVGRDALVWAQPRKVVSRS
jgi:hypothetical protein